MSEKVGSGDNAAHPSEMGQELLDWQDLPSSANLLRQPTETDTSDVADESEQPAINNQGRTVAQGRGELLLRAAAESLPEHDAPAQIGSGEIAPKSYQEERADRTSIDTVILRAEQALGREQFVDLTKGLLELSYREQPEQVMQKFRTEAEKVSTVDAGDLWDAVLFQAKQERFDQQRGQVKFYYTTDIEHLPEILKSGELMRTDNEGGALKSNLKFTCDYQKDSEWRSGFDPEGKKDSAAVTLVLDDKVIDEDDFVALGKEPSASLVGWQEYGLGVVMQDAETCEAVQRLLWKYNRAGDLPVYLEGQFNADWRGTYYAQDNLRQLRDKHHQEVWANQYLSELLYESGANDLVKRQMEPILEQIKPEEMRAFYERFYSASDLEAKKSIVTDLVGYLQNVLQVPAARAVQVNYVEQIPNGATAQHTRLKGAIEFSEQEIARVPAVSLVQAAAHEVRHVYQLWREDCSRRKIQVGDSEQRTYDKYCALNEEHYIQAEDDFAGYQKQFVEYDAYTFGKEAEKRYRAAEAEARRLSERARRMAHRMGQKITSLSERSHKPENSAAGESEENHG